MEQKKNLVQQTIKRIVQSTLRREHSEWPPVCVGVHYQPRRPETPLTKFSDGNSDEKKQ